LEINLENKLEYLNVDYEVVRYIRRSLNTQGNLIPTTEAKTLSSNLFKNHRNRSWNLHFTTARYLVLTK
jgi:hypothetical protein